MNLFSTFHLDLFLKVILVVVFFIIAFFSVVVVVLVNCMFALRSKALGWNPVSSATLEKNCQRLKVRFGLNWKFSKKPSIFKYKTIFEAQSQLKTFKNDSLTISVVFFKNTA